MHVLAKDDTKVSLRRGTVWAQLSQISAPGARNVSGVKKYPPLALASATKSYFTANVITSDMHACHDRVRMALCDIDQVMSADSTGAGRKAAAMIKFQKRPNIITLAGRFNQGGCA